MKNVSIRTLFPMAIIFLLLMSCGKATEQRAQMDAIAKRTSDSLRQVLDSALTDPEREIQMKQGE